MHNVNWEITQLPKLMSGLGIGNFQHRKLAFWAKWIWRFLTQEHALQQRLIDAKCYVSMIEIGWPRTIQSGLFRSPWRFIYQTINLVASCVQRSLGDGTFISFWTASWPSCGPIMIVFPRLNLLALFLMLLWPMCGLRQDNQCMGYAPSTQP